MHILIIRFSSMGDIVIQTPVLRWLKSSIKDLKITFITSKEFSDLVASNSDIDNLILYQRKKGKEDFAQLKALGNQINHELRPDLIIDLHNTLRAKIIKFFAWKIPNITVGKRSLRRFLFIKFKINLFKNLETHHERFIKDISSILHVPFDRNLLEEKSSVKSLTYITDPELSIKDNQLITISPIASFAPKRWGIDKFKELILLILSDSFFDDFHIKIVAGPKDTYCDELNSEEILNSNRVFNLQGKTSLAETNKILSESRVCITNDTGAGHISEAYGVPVLSIFGPTSEWFGFRPHLKTSKVISKDIWCRPCSSDGKKKCFRDKQYCMIDIQAIEVLEQLKLTLKESSHVV